MTNFSCASAAFERRYPTPFYYAGPLPDNGETDFGSYNYSYYKYGGAHRFTNVTIPKGSTILSAKLIVVAREYGVKDVCRARISGHLVANSLNFTWDQTDFDDRYANHRTAHIIDWDGVEKWSIINGIYNTIDFTSVVQEIIDQVDWASGNAMTIFLEDFDARSDVAAIRDPYSYSTTGKASILSVAYTPPAVNPAGSIVQLALEMGII